MRITVHHMRLILLLAWLCLFSACSDEGPYNYSQPPGDNASNLNMRGEPLRAPEPDNVAQIQEDLKALGYDPGPVSGTYDQQTKRAVIRFQKAQGICTDGCLGPITEQSIRKAIQAREALQGNIPANVRSQQKSSD
jgi:murein L,D-transpeptidase YcbB/YkuD